MDRLLLRPSEAAEMLGISRSKIYELLAERRVPSVRIGDRLRIPIDGLRRWVSDAHRDLPQVDSPVVEGVQARASGQATGGGSRDAEAS
jgi:excisionase family DNA binding protein